MSYKFDSKEIEKIDRLLNITTSIDETYTGLYRLELDGKKNTDEYRKLLDYLKSLKNIENNLYNDENLTLEKCSMWANYILSNKVHKNFFDGIEGIIIRDQKNRVFMRILGILKKKVIYDADNITRLMPKEMTDLLKNQNIPNLDKLTNYAIKSNIDINKAIEKDTFNGFLLFLQEFTNNDKYLDIKNELLQTKYDISFIDIDVENDMINNTFNIQNVLYEYARFTADLYQMPLEALNMVKNQNGSRNALIQISEIIKIKDEDYNDKEILITSILRQCLLKASLLSLTDNLIDDVNFKFHEIIDCPEYLSKNPQNNISENIIINCFKGIKKDREKQNTISFGYRKK